MQENKQHELDHEPEDFELEAAPPRKGRNKFLVMGAGMGIIAGFLLGNTGVGLVIGAALGYMIDRQREMKRDDNQPEG